MSTHNNHQDHDIVPMIIIMMLSGLLSTMNVWANSINDIRFSINDLYMALLMTSWMILFMGIFYKNAVYIFLGLVMVVAVFVAIREQLFISPKQYIDGMIPHHSMAIHMSKKLLQNNKNMNSIELEQLARNIVINQQDEINLMNSIH